MMSDRGRPKITVPTKQFRVTVPSADAEVCEWVKHQHNLSSGVRTLIKEFVSENGYDADSTCVQPETRKPQRLNANLRVPPEPASQAQIPPVLPQSDNNDNKEEDAAEMLASMMSDT
jgi:hypothetical protein